MCTKLKPGYDPLLGLKDLSSENYNPDSPLKI